MSIEEYNAAVDRYSDGVYRFILKNLSDEERAKDVVQDAFEKLWMKAENVSFSKVKSYLFSTAYHTMIDMLRKSKKETGIENLDLSNHTFAREYSDLNEVLHRAIKKLPDAQRSVILLRDYEGYSYDEISEITGLSESQVKVYIYRGRVFLRNYIGRLENII